MSETFDEAVERLRRETRLSKKIEELTGYVDVARGNATQLQPGWQPDDDDDDDEIDWDAGPAFRGSVPHPPPVKRRPPTSLRPEPMPAPRAPRAPRAPLARPVAAAGPAPWDRARQPQPARAPGDRIEVLRVSASDTEVLALCAQLEHHRETLRELTTCDFIGDVQEMLHKREPWLFEDPGEPHPKPECTGVAATWCPVHGECTCAHEYDLNEPDCPLHGTASDHAEAPPDPEAIARRLLGELGPELAAAVCVQLLGRLPRREP